MSLSVEVRDVLGTSTGSVTLDAAMFGIEPNVPVLHQVVTAQLAAARSGTQSTKTRAEVSGGGKKPFKQKGTGRARQGSERAPHFKGGGVALGPKPRSYRQRTPRKMIQLALRSALSDRAADGRVAVVRDWPWETPSGTRSARGALETPGARPARSLSCSIAATMAEAYKSFLQPDFGDQLILQGELNAYDILCNDWIVFTPDTLPPGHHPARRPAKSWQPRWSPVGAAAPARLAGRGCSSAGAEPASGANRGSAGAPWRGGPAPTARAGADADGGGPNAAADDDEEETGDE